MEDLAIIELYFARSEAAISETDKKYGKFRFSISNNILHHRLDAEESVNDTFLQAWYSIRQDRTACPRIWQRSSAISLLTA